MRREDELSRLIRIFLINNRELIFSLEDRDADELVLILKGYAWNILEFFFFKHKFCSLFYCCFSTLRYYHLFTGENVDVDEERDPWPEDCAPLYMSPHEVCPASWSYLNSRESRTRVVNFSMIPYYQPSTDTINVNHLFIIKNSSQTPSSYSSSSTLSPYLILSYYTFFLLT